MKMELSEIYGLSMAMVLGIGLGLFYFGGLWLTVQAVSKVNQPILLTLGSFLGRSAIILVGFYFLIGAGWQQLVAGLAGFILARIILVKRWQPVVEKEI
jgi:F1F0 ATPase subunit 2